MPFPFISSGFRSTSSALDQGYQGGSESGSKWYSLRNALSTSGPSASSVSPWSPFPKHITEQISTEIYELIIDQLRADKQSLLACTLVCRSWVPRSKCLLLELMVCWPVPLVRRVGFGKILCAAPYREGNEAEIIYGTTNGIYRGSKDDAPTRLLSIHHVSRIEILSDANLCLCIANGVFMSVLLSALNAGTCQDSDVVRLCRHVGFFSVYRASAVGESHRVCAIKTSSLSGTIKVFDVVGNQQASALLTAQDFYIPREAFYARFITPTRLAVALERGFAVHGGFEMVDLQTANTQTLLHPGDPALDSLPQKCKPIAVFRLSDVLLVCFDKVGIYIDEGGHIVRNELVMRWDSVPFSFGASTTVPSTSPGDTIVPALHEPYILVSSDTHVEVWNVETAEMVQKIQGPHYLLNAPESGERILAMSLMSGDVAEMVFHEH
ncbi:CNH domain-containing protein [Mycena maculata]|uniref:CNH domain-containing protein n=1 Tax=Mycena maculata TaxID=230809 RepID=A0AAD7JIP5_9AGAR|nr:CNH domain-containing protein [Mycena maculata]